MNDRTPIEFSWVSDRNAEKGSQEWRGFICVSPVGQRTETVQMYREEGLTVQKVHYDQKDIWVLNASKFVKDVIKRPEADWDQVCSRRYIIHTETALPSCVGRVNVRCRDKERKTKLIYYHDRLKAYLANYCEIVSAMEAVLPGNKMKDEWSKFAFSIDTMPLLREMGKIATAKPDMVKEACFAFVLLQNKEGVRDAPAELVELANSIWKVLCDSVLVIDRTHAVMKPSDQMVSLLSVYRGILGVPVPNARQVQEK
jgi:hypothetical protein